MDKQDPQPEDLPGILATGHWTRDGKHAPNFSAKLEEGFRDALRDKGKSLLPPGVARCNGDFTKGDVVRICDLNGTEFSRGISRFDADEIRARKLKGIEIVHRNDLVIL